MGLRPVRAGAPPGREQASIQLGRVIQAGLRLNSRHSMPALTFPDLVTLPVFLGFRLFLVRIIERWKILLHKSYGTFASLAYSLPKPVRPSPEPVAHTGRSAHKPDLTPRQEWFLTLHSAISSPKFHFACPAFSQHTSHTKKRQETGSISSHPIASFQYSNHTCLLPARFWKVTAIVLQV